MVCHSTWQVRSSIYLHTIVFLLQFSTQLFELFLERHGLAEFGPGMVLFLLKEVALFLVLYIVALEAFHLSEQIGTSSL